MLQFIFEPFDWIKFFRSVVVFAAVAITCMQSTLSDVMLQEFPSLRELFAPKRSSISTVLFNGGIPE